MAISSFGARKVQKMARGLSENWTRVRNQSMSDQVGRLIGCDNLIISNRFVKHYRAHLSPITSVSASADGLMYASVSTEGQDGSIKIFDVQNFGKSLGDQDGGQEGVFG